MSDTCIACSAAKIQHISANQLSACLFLHCTYKTTDWKWTISSWLQPPTDSSIQKHLQACLFLYIPLKENVLLMNSASLLTVRQSLLVVFFLIVLLNRIWDEWTTCHNLWFLLSKPRHNLRAGFCRFIFSLKYTYLSHVHRERFLLLAFIIFSRLSSHISFSCSI